MFKQGLSLALGLGFIMGAAVLKEATPGPRPLVDSQHTKISLNTSVAESDPGHSSPAPASDPEALAVASASPDATAEATSEPTLEPTPIPSDEPAPVDEPSFPGPRPQASSLTQLHQQAVVVDTKVYTPTLLAENPKIHLRSYKGQADLQQLKEGGVDVVFLSVFVNPYRFQQKALPQAEYMLNRLRQEMNDNKTWIEWANSYEDIERIVKSGKIAALVGLENPAPLGNNLAHLERLYKQGVRYISPAWSTHSEWADSAALKTARWNGLSPLGKQAIQKMNDLGILIDVSQVSDAALSEILQTSQQPVIASQRGTAQIHAHPLNLSDENLKRLHANGGVLGVPLTASQLGQSQDIKAVIQHLDHTANAAGLENVGLGSGFESQHSQIAAGIQGAKDYPRLTEALSQRGYSEKQIYQMMGENYLRVFRQVLK